MNTRRDFFRWLAAAASVPLLPRIGEVVKQEPGKHGVWIALYRENPDGGSPIEVSGAGYERQFVAHRDWMFDPSKLSVCNAREIDFGMAGTPWGYITHAAIIGADGMILPAAMAGPVQMTSGCCFKFPRHGMNLATEDGFGPQSFQRRILDHLFGRET